MIVPAMSDGFGVSTSGPFGIKGSRKANFLSRMRELVELKERAVKMLIDKRQDEPDIASS